MEMVMRFNDRSVASRLQRERAREDGGRERAEAARMQTHAAK